MYSNIRETRARDLRRQRRINACKEYNKAIFYGIIWYLCYVLGAKSENYYTINHYEYNRHILSGLVCFYIIKTFTIVLFGNCGIRTRSYCFNSMLAYFFILLRTAMLGAFLYFVVPKIFWVLQETLVLNDKNWWKNGPNEAMFSSDSKFNSLVCWYFWLHLIVFECVAISVLGFMCLVGCCFTCCACCCSNLDYD